MKDSIEAWGTKLHRNVLACYWKRKEDNRPVSSQPGHLIDTTKKLLNSGHGRINFRKRTMLKL